MILCNKKTDCPFAELLKTTTDFKILLLSWIYDLNFSASLRLLSDKGYMQRIASELPQTKEIKKASEILEELDLEDKWSGPDMVRACGVA